MSSVTERIKQVNQPGDGILPPSRFTEVDIPAREELAPMQDEDIAPELIGNAVDYLTRLELGEDRQKVFRRSLEGARAAGDEESARWMIDRLSLSLSDETIGYALQLVSYISVDAEGNDSVPPVGSINPNTATCRNIRAMVNRAADFFRGQGRLIDTGIRFDRAYTLLVQGGEADYLTEDCLWDLKTSIRPISAVETLQILVYYRLGIRTGRPEFRNLKRIGIYNARQSKSYTINVEDIGEEIFKIVDRDVIGYTSPMSDSKLTSEGDQPHFDVDIDASDYFSYPKYHTDAIIKANPRMKIVSTPFSFIRHIVIDNHTDDSYENLILNLRFSSSIFSPLSISTGPVKALQHLEIEQGIDPEVDQERLYGISGITPCTITLDVRDPRSESIIKTISKTVKILPIEQCSETRDSLYPQLLAKYCVTDFSEMRELHLKAAQIYGRSLIGYQNTDVNDIVREVSCIYEAVHDWGITYSNPPQSAGGTQNIRLPNAVLRQRMGTCIDLAILFCSALIEVGIHPILITLEDHALAGFFLDEQSSYDFVERKVTRVQNDIAGLPQRAVLFECTTVDASSRTSFKSAINIAKNTITGYRGAFFATDVHTCQSSFLKPIPLPRDDGKIDLEIPKVDLTQEDLEAIDRREMTPIRKAKSDRFTTWEKSLLDLTTANKLVNFRVNKKRDNWAQILGLSSGDLYSLLKDRESETFDLDIMTGNIFEENTGESIASILPPLDREQLEKRARSGLLYVSSTPKILKKLIAVDRSAREETGSPTLYLALGQVNGYIARKQIAAPFLLLPVTLTKKRVGEGYRMTYSFDDIMVNQTFFEYVKSKTGHDYSPLYGMSSDDDYRNVTTNFRSISGDPSVSLDESCVFIANFTFAHYVMWKDMRERQEDLRQNKVVSSLLENRSLVENQPVLTGLSADQMDDVSRFAAPLPYDSTQLRAILESAAGNSFILDGPPGTGKSQTIVNMIANAMYNGKTVLFVAEKQAALEVVRKRLANLKFDVENGLDTFALQLYSTKADKKSVFDQLDKAMKLGALRAGKDVSHLGEEILEKRRKVVEELNQLHDSKGRYFSLFDAYRIQKSTEEEKGKFTLPAGFADTYDEERERVVIDLLKRIDLESGNISEYPSVPTAIFSFTEISPSVQRNASSLIRAHLEKYDRLTAATDRFTEVIKIAKVQSIPEIARIVEVTRAVLDAGSDIGNVRIAEYFADDEGNRKCLSSAQEIYEIDSSLGELLTDEGFDRFPAEEVRKAVAKANSGFFGRLFFKGKPFKVSRQYLKSQEPVSNSVLLDICDKLDRRKDLAKVCRSNTSLARFAGFDIAARGADIKALKDRYERAFRCRKIGYTPENNVLFDYITEAVREKPEIVRTEFDRLDGVYLTSKAGSDSLDQVLPVYSDTAERRGYREALSDAADYLDVSLHQEELTYLARINGYGKQLDDLGLGDLFAAIREGRIATEYAWDALQNALATQVVDAYCQEDYARDFSSSLYNDELAKYDSLIREYRNLSVQAVAERVTSRYLDKNFGYSKDSPLGTLKKLVSNGGRGMTIRTALSPTRYEKAFRTYFPCFLMSPLAAAQYLQPNAMKFDIVIFDEASQIPTAEGVGPIARGNALIVGGDPKQMPPNQHFSANINSLDDGDEDSEEKLALMDSDSLLDDCISIGLPDRRLAFHYRSRHESLIEFSNQGFYDGSLFTFPSPDNSTPHIQFRLVDRPNKVDSSMSEEERDAILDCVKEILTSPAAEGKSLGIILFNVRQQQTLIDAVDKLFTDEPELGEKAHWNGDPDDEQRMFVKNLESVQGDERDIIILSIGFSRNNNGSARLGGPLLEDGGARRLNVAASRAREQMIVISTIQSSDIRTEGHQHDGAESLKTLLEYAETASGSGSVNRSDRERIDQSTRHLKERIEDSGYLVDTDVGSSEFRIDLALREKDDADGRYILGIILDNRPASVNTSTTDRFVVEPDFLENLGWQILRVYTFDLIREPEMTLRRILEAAEKGVEKKASQPASDLPRMSQAPDAMAQYIVPYEKCPRSSVRIDYNFLVGQGVMYDRRLSSAIDWLVRAEGPVSYTRIKEYARDIMGISRVGEKADRFIQNSMRTVPNLGLTIDFGNEKFYWIAGQENITRFRKSDRDILQIPKEEIIFLMARVCEVAKQIDRSDLIRSTADYMDMALTEKVRNKLNYCVECAKNRGLLGHGFVETYPNSSSGS